MTQEEKESLLKEAEKHLQGLPQTVWQYSLISDVRDGYIKGAEWLDTEIVQPLRKENEGLKAKVNELTAADMTHEYNQAEAEKFRPEYERQLLEPLQNLIRDIDLRLDFADFSAEQKVKDINNLIRKYYDSI